MKETQRKIFILICFAAAIVSGIVFSYNLILVGSPIAIASERTNKVSPASEADKYTAFLMFASDDWSVVRMEPEESGQNTVITGDGTYTVSLTESGIVDVSGINVFCVDMIGLADAQNLNVSNIRIKDVVIKCDGHVIPADMSKMYFGCIERQGTLRLEICNYYGLQKKDGADFWTYEEFDQTKFAFVKSLSVTFTLEGITEGSTPTTGNYKITTAAGEKIVELPREESASASPVPGASMSAVPVTSAKPSGTPDALPETPAKPSGTPDVLSETSAKPSGTPDVLSETSAKPSGTPDVLSETSAKPSGTPDVLPETSSKPYPGSESSPVPSSVTGASKSSAASGEDLAKALDIPITAKSTTKPVESTAGSSGNVKNTKKKIYKNRKKITITTGQQVQLKYTKLKGKLRWKSSWKKTATVNQKGYVTGKKKGKTTITVTGKKKKYSCIVTVKPARKKSYLSKTSVVLTGGDDITLELINPSETVKWYIETTEYAGMNSYGSKNQFCEIKTNGSGKEGTFLVTASAGKYVYTCEVTVKIS